MTDCVCRPCPGCEGEHECRPFRFDREGWWCPLCAVFQPDPQPDAQATTETRHDTDTAPPGPVVETIELEQI